MGKRNADKVLAESAQDEAEIPGVAPAEDREAGFVGAEPAAGLASKPPDFVAVERSKFQRSMLCTATMRSPLLLLAQLLLSPLYLQVCSFLSTGLGPLSDDITGGTLLAELTPRHHLQTSSLILTPVGTRAARV